MLQVSSIRRQLGQLGGAAHMTRAMRTVDGCGLVGAHDDLTVFYATASGAVHRPISPLPRRRHHLQASLMKDRTQLQLNRRGCFTCRLGLRRSTLRTA